MLIIGVVPSSDCVNLAEVASELIDTEIYQRWIERFPNAAMVKGVSF